jgi:hypothetical protein
MSGAGARLSVTGSMYVRLGPAGSQADGRTGGTAERRNGGTADGRKDGRTEGRKGGRGVIVDIVIP